MSVSRRTALRSAGVFVACASPVFALLASVEAGVEDNRAFDELLARYLVQGSDGINRVNYARWHADAADRARLADYLATLAVRRPSAMSRNEAFAFWANLYNATTLKVVLDNYPVRSIRDIKSSTSFLDLKGFFGPLRSKLVTLEGRSLSLDDIEHEIMRPTFKDPRVHYAVNCAAVGCPNLASQAWHAETLDKDLDAAARAFINNPRGLRVDGDGSVHISSIYRWYKEDFGGTDAGIIAHLRGYAGREVLAKIPTNPQSLNDDYDWSLNDAK